MNSDNIIRLTHGDKQVVLLGTAHVSSESVKQTAALIEEEKPDTVCVELCNSRYQAIMNKSQWQETDLIKLIREKKAFLLLSNLFLAHFQKKIGQKLGVKPGEEMLQAIRSAQMINAQIHLADRDIRTTLARAWRLMGFWSKIKLAVQLLGSVGEANQIEQQDIEKMKKEDMLETVLSELGELMPELRDVLIFERDQYLAHKIRTADGRKIVAVVGAGHVPGIKQHWEEPVDVAALEEVPPKGPLTGILKWAIPCLIVALIVAGFFASGQRAGTDMIKSWVLANAVFSGIGALIILPHPLTVLSAMFASPVTSLNPMIAAGWVSGLVETLLRKPKVKDFEDLRDDIASLKTFWKNRITRVLLVVVFTNLGSTVGTLVAIPLMTRILIRLKGAG